MVLFSFLFLLLLGPPYLIENNRDMFNEVCKVNPSLVLIHDQLRAKSNPNYTGPRRRKVIKGAGFAAIHYAALYANAILLRMLLQANADVNLQATCGRTPLLIACAGTYPDHRKVAKILVGSIISLQPAVSLCWLLLIFRPSIVPLNFCFLSIVKAWC